MEVERLGLRYILCIKVVYFVGIHPIRSLHKAGSLRGFELTMIKEIDLMVILDSLLLYMNFILYS